MQAMQKQDYLFATTGQWCRAYEMGLPDDGREHLEINLSVMFSFLLRQAADICSSGAYDVCHVIEEMKRSIEDPTISDMVYYVGYYDEGVTLWKRGDAVFTAGYEKIFKISAKRLSGNREEVILWR